MAKVIEPSLGLSMSEGCSDGIIFRSLEFDLFVRPMLTPDALVQIKE